MFPVLIRKAPCRNPTFPVVAPDSAQKTAKTGLPHALRHDPER